MSDQFAICPICFENLKTDLYFCSDGYLYDKKCFKELNFKSPITRQIFSYYLPIESVNGLKVIFEKEAKNNVKKIIYDSTGFDQDGFNKEGFDKDGYDRSGFDKDGFNRNKELVDENKVIQAIRNNPWNVYYAHDRFKNTFEIMKECVEMEPNTYQYSSISLKENVELAIFFLKQGGSFSLISKHLRNNKSVGMLSVEINAKNFQYLGKNLRDDDDIFKLAVEKDKKMFEYASERLRKTHVQKI